MTTLTLKCKTVLFNDNNCKMLSLFSVCLWRQFEEKRTVFLQPLKATRQANYAWRFKTTTLKAPSVNTALKQMAGEVAVLEFSAFLYLCSRLTSEALLFAICFKPENVNWKRTTDQKEKHFLTKLVVCLIAFFWQVCVCYFE